MSWLKRTAIWPALILAAIHVVLSLAYASETPYLHPGYTNGQLLDDIGAPDESAHIAYVRYVLRERAIPVLRPEAKESKVLYEAHQAPLYYVLDATWFSLFGRDVVEGPGLALRALNALIGSGAVLGVFCFALWTTGRRRTALLCAAIPALLPMMCALDGAVSNDPLIICISTWTLALMVRFRNQWSINSAIGVGFLVELGILTKSTGVLLVPPLLLAIYSGGRAKWTHLGAACLGISLFALPWFIRNQMVYGDPFGMTAFYSYFPRGVWPSEVFSGFRPFAHWMYVLLSGTALSSVGIFGYMDIHLRYRIYVPILILFGLGFLGAVWRKRESDPRVVDRPSGLFVILVIAGFVSYNLWQVQPQARYLFPAVAPLSFWIVLGLERLLITRPWLFPSLLCALLLTADLSALAMLPSEFEKRTSEADRRHAVSPLRSSPDLQSAK